jgi:hypothetical protein
VSRRMAFAAAVTVAGLGAAGPALVANPRAVQALGWVGAATVLLAVVTGRRWSGTLAVVVVTAGLLSAAASDPRPTAALLACSLLLLGMVVGLDGAERSRAGGAVEALRTGAPAQRVVPPLLAVAGAGAVALAARGPVVPSVWLALAGLAAVAAALAVATRPR